MKSFFVLILFAIALACVSLTETADAKPVPYKASSCAIVLNFLRPYHAVPDTSYDHTQEAVQAIRSFRLNELQSPVAEPSGQIIDLNSWDPSGNNKKGVVAQRLRGVEKDFAQAQSSNDDNPQNQFLVAGSIIRGDKNIHDYLEKTDKLEEQMEKAGPLAQWSGQVDLRYQANRDAIELVSHSANPEQWHFDSLNGKIDSELLQTLWNRGEPLDATRLAAGNENQINKLLFTFFDPLVNEDAATAKEVHIQMDRLASVDPETNEPRLTIFIRTSLEKPQVHFPKWRRPGGGLREMNPMMVPQLVPVLVPVPVSEPGMDEPNPGDGDG